MSEAMREVHARNRAQYAVVAERYAVSESHGGGEDLDWFRGRVAEVPPGLALDVACGGGFSTRALVDAGHTAVATDLTAESVVAARGAGSAAIWAAAAAEHLPVQTESMVLVTCRIAAHHFADPARFVDEVVRVLVPGGVFLLVDTVAPEDDSLARWINEVERLRDPSHGVAWSTPRWLAVLAGARLQVTETRLTRKRHALEQWLARAACEGELAATVRAAFRDAEPSVAAAFSVELDTSGNPLAYTDSKLCLRAVKR